HTQLSVGGNTNFAGTFPLWDILFGTFRMPVDELPREYRDEAAVPSEIAGQLAFPFRR
ncbi:MAG: sterol desaturase family protein, partial [Bradyrhizobium sp.]|uniref:sterol desaturase family protein n=1 Tax=Bradyrhizobium sp. TaxID=376 RepID=UPI001D1C613F|nr:sterol desaturase family protein [Bradyrhizobium sp.]